MVAQDTSFHHRRTLRHGDRIIDLSTPRVMGILNITPDSFHDGGRYITVSQAVDQALLMLDQGATYIDIGGASSRPGAHEVPADEENERVIPVIEALLRAAPDALISVDTYRADVAENALRAGALMINDISAGLTDGRMLEVVAEAKVPYICMHMQGRPRDMQDSPTYEHVVAEVLAFFSERLVVLKKAGIIDVIIDPGFGFGKTVAHNYSLMAHLDQFAQLGAPVLTGVSRKSMIYTPLGITSQESLNGSTALHMAALLKKSSLLRVHDVVEAVECVKLWEMMRDGELD